MAKKTTKQDDSSADTKDKSSKLFDVAKPGETPANATSRPIIVSHSSMIKKDPMVREPLKENETAAGSSEEVSPPIQTHSAAVISPLKADKKDEESAEKSAEEPLATEEPEASEAEEVKTEETVPEENAEKNPEKEKPDEPVKSESGTVDALVGQVTAKREEQKQKEEAEAKVREIEKIIESKEFYVPIGQESRRRSAHRVLAVLLLLIILCAVGANFAIDAGMLDLGISPATDLL